MKNYAVGITKYVAALVFVYAGIYKISDVSLFMAQMYQSPLIPQFLVAYLAYLLPIVEILLGLMLIFSRPNNTLMWLSFSLMLFFSIYLLMLYTLYDKPPCACGGILNNMDYPEHILFNFTITILLGATLIKNRNNEYIHN